MIPVSLLWPLKQYDFVVVYERLFVTLLMLCTICLIAEPTVIYLMCGFMNCNSYEYLFLRKTAPPPPPTPIVFYKKNIFKSLYQNLPATFTNTETLKSLSLYSFSVKFANTTISFVTIIRNFVNLFSVYLACILLISNKISNSSSSLSGSSIPL
jgi:hypothetical protein